jgi:biopolymer transport protein ExbD
VFAQPRLFSNGLTASNFEIVMSRKKTRAGDEEVELNLAAMLDMAFQLLTFFILTFKPAPVEGQISIRMPPPQAIAEQGDVPPGWKPPGTDLLKGFNTLAINLVADEGGKLSRIDVAQQKVTVDDRLKMFSAELDKKLNVENSPFDQVVISVPTKLHYSELMRVMGVCSRQTLGGDPHNKLTKLSLVDEKNPNSP